MSWKTGIDRSGKIKNRHDVITTNKKNRSARREGVITICKIVQYKEIFV